MIDLVKLAAILAVILVLIRLKWNLGLVLALAACLTALFFGRSLAGLLADAAGALIDPLTLQLAAIVLLIAFLGEILRSTLQLEGLVAALTGLLAGRRPRGHLFSGQVWLLALLPLLIGMLPMVGGAMFSAPMVDEASQGLDMGRERRTFINYWFRHAVEPILPLYPSLVLAAGLLGVTPRALTATQWPLALAGLAGGVLFGLLGLHPPAAAGETTPRREAAVLLARSVWPILLVLVLALALHVPLILALAVTVAVLLAASRQPPRQIAALARRVPLGTLPIIGGAMIFRSVLDHSGAVEKVAAALGQYHVPLPLVVFFAPFVPGLFTGLLTAAFAIGFPIALPLCGPDPVASGYGLLAYTGGLCGMMLSPMHLCLSLTRAYYRAEWGGLYRHIVPAVLLVAVTAAVVLAVKLAGEQIFALLGFGV